MKRQTYIKDIYLLPDGRYEIEIIRNGKAERHYYQTEEEGYEAYVAFCEEIYS